ncbi:AAA family ATPase [Acetivibrio straminisolvens]|jgi:predicted ATPase|uniref:ABC transporter ATP-binding protein n=1 Tax=Acetivibrio straminisolvens JCM 21531 TaxID=1294263 RepID=W4V1T5_9FIRM|nr:AAA family ATPase [Acetivibrio straminisolvens]GAE87186.1 ABC transporter ATP-binding protein [Acetivibrio straminisolvens JCM 21531]
MRLTLKNICKIKEATVDLNGITVIAGENNTGKSTVGKILYSVFNSFYKIDDQIYKEREESIKHILSPVSFNAYIKTEHGSFIEAFISSIINDEEKYKSNPELLKQELRDFVVQLDKHNMQSLAQFPQEEMVNRILEVISIPRDVILKTILTKKINTEFNGQVNNIYANSKGGIELIINNETILIEVQTHKVQSISNVLNLNTEVIYIDDPFVLDEGMYRGFPLGRYIDHRHHLKLKLFDNSKDNVINEMLTANKLENIYSKINNICSGELVKNKYSNYGYKKTGEDEVLELRNISTGLKTFVILKTLLLNRSLEENGTIILDEPEIHLHPEWQLIFAELIVLLQKEFGVRILLNTHSPYFLNAIEVYAAKHKIADRCKYYIADLDEDAAIISDVTENIEEIYRKLAGPLQDLENVRYNND